MTTNLHKLTVSRELAAPRERVWQVWTDARHIQQWLSLGEDVAIESVKTDLRVGGRFRLQQRMADGEYYTAAGTYLEVNEPERLVYTWDWEKDGSGEEFGELEGNETRVTVVLEPLAEGKSTRLVLTHENFASAKSRDGHEHGWGQWLDRLERFLRA